ncbi:hypothetical protein [Vibrio sp. CAU 1672]|uniref:hypothetical protein n=1 Tax=Vibrio sp. CAU 1672 TaxID=3032594 RepID=UPI0023DA17EE|nr:hypothetical protein [Vibrio sp. CAU 1672]MDF2152302.1 hypothetical protein [Vibrio sp. CAU 1672]
MVPILLLLGIARYQRLDFQRLKSRQPFAYDENSLEFREINLKSKAGWQARQRAGVENRHHLKFQLTVLFN